MPSLLFVADGPRDAAMLPQLVEKILGVEIQAGFAWTWAGIRLRGGGYDRKLGFAMRDAVDRGLSGVVATVDRDLAPTGNRWRALEEGRAKERSDARSPAVVL